MAWYRVMREAEGQVETKRIEIAEKVFDANRKQVAVKDVATAIAQWEGELREYTNMTGREAEDSLKVVHLKRKLPKTIRDMLQTVRLTTFKECKEYALEQARAQRNEKEASPKAALDLGLSEDEREKKKVHFEEDAVTEGRYNNDDWLCWRGKPPPPRSLNNTQRGNGKRDRNFPRPLLSLRSTGAQDQRMPEDTC